MNYYTTPELFALSLSKLQHVKEATVDAHGQSVRVHYSHRDVDFTDGQWTAKMQHAFKQLGPVHGVRVSHSDVDRRWACFTIHIFYPA